MRSYIVQKRNDKRFPFLSPYVGSVMEFYVKIHILMLHRENQLNVQDTNNRR
jgi:hypothetical protein